MRTTVDFSPDVLAVLEEIRRTTGQGLSRIVNDLLRQAVAVSAHDNKPFVQRSAALGISVDVSNVHDLLDSLDD